VSTFAERAAEGISRCTAADISDLREFQSRMYGDQADQIPSAFMEWLYDANPQSTDGAIGLRIARRDGAIVGQQGEWPVELRIDGELFPAGYAIELMVGDPWRLRGVGPALAEAQRQGQRIACAVGMNDGAQRMYEKSGWIDLGHVVRYVAMVPGARATRAETWPKVAMAQAIQFASSPFRAVRAMHARHHELLPIDAFDERSDDIWARAAPAYRVLARRDAESLRWRFDVSPYAHLYRRFLLLNRGFPTGYVVLRKTAVRGAVTMRIVDYLAPLGELSALFSLCVEEARRGGDVGFVDVLTRNQPAVPILAAVGFVPASRVKSLARFADTVRFMVTVADDDPLRAELADPRSWFLTGGDADIDVIDVQAGSIRAAAGRAAG
jgi:hypothetical protein